MGEFLEQIQGDIKEVGQFLGQNQGNIKNSITFSGTKNKTTERMVGQFLKNRAYPHKASRF